MVGSSAGTRTTVVFETLKLVRIGGTLIRTREVFQEALDAIEAPPTVGMYAMLYCRNRLSVYNYEEEARALRLPPKH